MPTARMPEERRRQWQAAARETRRLAALVETLACGAVDTHGEVRDWRALEAEVAALVARWQEAK